MKRMAVAVVTGLVLAAGALAGCAGTRAAGSECLVVDEVRVSAAAPETMLDEVVVVAPAPEPMLDEVVVTARGPEWMLEEVVVGAKRGPAAAGFLADGVARQMSGSREL